MSETCACGAIVWPAGVISLVQGDVHHWPQGLVCFALDGADLWAMA